MRHGGAIYSLSFSISFKENSTTEFTNNTARYGGAINSIFSSVSFKHFSNTKFNNNRAELDGGAIYSAYQPISSKDNSHIEFNDNLATRGGAIFCINNYLSFEGFSTRVFSNDIPKELGRDNFLSFERIFYYSI